MDGPPPGWYPDPADEADLRWWDGDQWTAPVYDITTADPEDGRHDPDHIYESDPDGTGVETPIVLHVRRLVDQGADQLVFTRADGEFVGAADLGNGRVMTEFRSLELDLHRALEEWCGVYGRPVPGRQPRRSGEPRSVPFADPPLLSLPPRRPPVAPVDLAHRRPAHGVLEMDERIRSQAPRRSWWRRLLSPAPITSWNVGAQGEIAVANVLGSLGDGWKVLHSVPVGRQGADIDHIVIGPPGVFTINTKHHPHSSVTVTSFGVRVGAHSTDYLASARIEADRAERLLSRACGQRVSVLPLIVVISRQVRLETSPIDVDVLDGRDLAAWLCRQRPTLSAAEVRQVFEHARWSNMWTV